MEYYDSLGEVWYAAQFYARALARLDLYVGNRPAGADPNEEPEKVEDANAVALLDRIQDPGGGRMNILGTYGRLRFLCGEAYLVYTAAQTHEDPNTGEEIEDAPETWEMLSIDEIRIVTGGGYMRLKAPGLPMEMLKEAPDDMYEEIPPGTGIVYRLYKPHPRFSQLSDAPMFGVLDICEELLLLTLAVRSRATNRAAGPGILYVPDELSFSPDEPEGDEDPEEDIFIQDLTEALTTPLKDPGDASAVVPLMVRGPAEFADALKQITFRTEGTYPEAQLRQEAIERLATGLDMPKQALLGLEDMNHWNAWQVDEDTWKAHLEPIAMELCQDLTAAYFRPAAQELGLPNADTMLVWYDASRVINHPDKSTNAQQLHDRAALSDEALRRENGFDETDKPTDAERAFRLGVLVRDGGLAITGVPTLKSGSTPEGDIEPLPGQDEPTAPPPPAEPQTPGPGADGKPPPSSPPEGGGGGAHAIIGAAELTVEVARSRAGAKLRQALRKTNCEDCLAQIEHVPNRIVPAVLATLRATNPTALPAIPPDELVSGSTEALLAQLVKWGVDTIVAKAICKAVETHAAMTLFEDRPAALSPQALELIQFSQRIMV